MSTKTWEERVLQTPGVPERVGAIEDGLRLAAGLTVLREQAGLSQRELAQRIGVSQPRIAAIERSRNVTIDVLDQYVRAVGGRLEIAVVKGQRKVSLLSGSPKRVKAASASRAATVANSPTPRHRVSTKSTSSSSVAVAKTKSRSKSRHGVLGKAP
jgi:transcriptional regulator with XRE-family HTH domain